VKNRPPKHGATMPAQNRTRFAGTYGVAIVRALAASFLFTSAAAAADWSPAKIDEESILEFQTVHEGDTHWSKVWMVVVDGDVYVNLGDRAVERLRTNNNAPIVAVRVAGDEFERVRVEAAQERQPAVARAIADKYWTGFLVPYRPPSQVMRLRPE
jgi:hypothetical protein